MIFVRNNNIYVVMYHYVREIKKSKFPNLKGLEFKDFKSQINFFKKNYNILSPDDFAEIVNTKKIPKKKSIILTFDDGYADHWKFVFPFLKKKKICGFFYPVVNALKNKEVLDVNKIQFLLAKEENRKKILDFIFIQTKKLLNRKNIELDLNNIDTNSRYDDKKTVLIKKLLQSYLPSRIRKKIVNNLFNLVLDTDEVTFSKNLYMNDENLLEMYENNMTFGSHGTTHYWLDKLNFQNQSKEIINSILYYKNLKIFDKEKFSVCYPHGRYNTDTIKVLKKLKIKFAFSTEVKSINSKNISNKFKLPRYDTNDFKL